MFDAIILTAVLGALFGLVLAVASRRLHIETDLRIAAVTALLPGANCGACGFPGCSALAEAIAAGTAKTNACAVADAEAKNKIAAIMNHDGEEEASGPQIAALACNGRLPPCRQPACRTGQMQLRLPGAWHLRAKLPL